MSEETKEQTKIPIDQAISMLSRCVYDLNERLAKLEAQLAAQEQASKKGFEVL
jgi:hypothetical protein